LRDTQQPTLLVHTVGHLDEIACDTATMKIKSGSLPEYASAP
jgi:hypothetical protein